MDKTAALILAAGKGTRMHSATPKVLQKVLGEPMLAYVRAALHPVFEERIWTVIGHGADQVRASFPEETRFILQAEQLGTGHALATAIPELRKAGMERVLVVNGDMPLITEDEVRAVLDGAGDSAVAAASIILDDPASYGRIVRREGRFAGIVEAKDYDPAVYGTPTGEINAGVYVLDISVAERLLPRLGCANKSGEYYITDLAAMALEEKLDVRAIPCGRESALLGVNSPAELAAAEEVIRGKLVARCLASGVRIHFPGQVVVGPDVSVEPGAELWGPCQIYGRSVIEAGATVHPFCHITDAVVGTGAIVGPYARLRPGAVVGESAHVGNFVELKKAVLGKGAKANHLSYLGDAEIGAGTNIGAGTITCNYDGVHKHRTSIGEHAFIGSNTALVAPVSIGAGALVGAGSVITKDVPEDKLAVARGRQVVLPLRTAKKD